MGTARSAAAVGGLGPRARALTLAALVAIMGCGGASQPAPLYGRQAAVPSFDLPRLGGGRVTLDEHRGHPLLVFMFTTWSLRGQVEAPLIVQLHDRLGPRGLHVIGVALDHDALALVRTYVGYLGFRFDVALAEPDDLELVGAFGKTRHVPRTLLLDRKGRIVEDYQGRTDLAALEAALAELLQDADG